MMQSGAISFTSTWCASSHLSAINKFSTLSLCLPSIHTFVLKLLARFSLLVLREKFVLHSLQPFYHFPVQTVYQQKMFDFQPQDQHLLSVKRLTWSIFYFINQYCSALVLTKCQLTRFPHHDLVSRLVNDGPKVKAALDISLIFQKFLQNVQLKWHTYSWYK